MQQPTTQGQKERHPRAAERDGAPGPAPHIAWMGRDDRDHGDEVPSAAARIQEDERPSAKPPAV